MRVNRYFFDMVAKEYFDLQDLDILILSKIFFNTIEYKELKCHGFNVFINFSLVLVLSVLDILFLFFYILLFLVAVEVLPVVLEVYDYYLEA